MTRRIVRTTSAAAVLLALSSVAFTSTYASTLGHVWSRHYGDTADQVNGIVAFDPAGAIVAASHFQGSIDFGGGPLTSSGGWDVYLAKLDGAGNHIWSISYGSTGDQFVTDMAVDVVGNVFITGIFFGSVDFGGGVLTSAGDIDFYIAKFNWNGVYQWSMRFGDLSRQRFSVNPSIAVDGIGDAIMVGELNGTADFGGGLLTGNPSNVQGRVFLAKFNSAGSHSWSTVLGGASNTASSAWDVATDASANIIITASSFNTDFGGGELSGFFIALAKYTKSGAHIWSQGVARPGGSHASTLTVDSAGRIVMAGEFTGTIDFGGGPLTNCCGAMFIARYDANGSHLMSKQFDNGGGRLVPTRLHDVTTDAANNIVVVGSAQNAANWGGGTLLGNGGIVACYDSSGTHQWSDMFSGSGSSVAGSVDAKFSSVVVGGWFNATVDVGGGVLTTAGGSDALIARFGDVAAGVRPEPVLPTGLVRGYPNPFNPTVTISYEVRTSGPVSIAVFNAAGARVASPIDAEFRPAGVHDVALSLSGSASGVYFVRVTTVDTVADTRVVMVK